MSWSPNNPQRYWYTVRSPSAGVWESGWAFGDSFESAAKYAVERELKYGRRRTIQGCLQVHLQRDVSPAEYETINMELP